MKPWMPVALLVAMSSVALAKPSPIELPIAIVNAATINRGSVASVQENTVGAMREREYFEAPQSPLKAFPCRIKPVLFDKVRMAQSCR